jgi:ribosomal protein S18 acetylase RimI-like enzyme
MKLISAIIIAAMAQQGIASAYPGEFYSLRTMAFDERKDATRPKTKWLDVEELVDFMANAPLVSRRITTKDEALSAIGDFDGLLDRHKREIVDRGPMDLMSETNLNSAVETRLGDMAIIDFEFADSAYDHFYGIYKDGRIIGYGLYSVSLDFTTIWNFRLTILEETQQGNAYEALKLVLGMCYQRFSLQGIPLTAIKMEAFSDLDGRIRDYAWRTQTPVFFVRAGFDPVAVNKGALINQITALREGRLGLQDRAALNEKIFDSDLILTLRQKGVPGNEDVLQAGQTQDIEIKIADVVNLDDKGFDAAMEAVKTINDKIGGIFSVRDNFIRDSSLLGAYYDDPHYAGMEGRLKAFLAIADGRVIGYIIYNYEKRKSKIEYFAVDPDFQRGGAGTKLLKMVFKSAREKGNDVVVVETSGRNLKGGDFYRKRGAALSRYCAEESIDNDVSLRFTFCLTRWAMLRQQIADAAKGRKVKVASVSADERARIRKLSIVSVEERLVLYLIKPDSISDI